MNSHQPANKWQHRFLVLIVLFAYLALAVGSSFTKRPWIDEAYQANCALDVVTRGTAGLTLVEPSGFITRPGQYFHGINQYNFLWMPIPYYGMAIWYKLFGFSLLTTRLFSVACGLMLLAACWTIVWQLTGDRMLALLSMFLVGIDRVVIDAASDGRADMMAGAFCFAGLAVYLYLREKHLDLAVFAGHCLIAVGIFSHPVALNGFFGGVFLALYLDRERLRWKHLFLAGLAYVLALAGWGLFILQDRVDFWPQFSAATRSRGSSIFAPWRALGDEISKRYLHFYLPPYAQGAGRLRVLIPLVYFLAAIGAWMVTKIRQDPGRRALLTLAALYFVVMTLGEGLKSYYYMIHIVPVLACTLAIGIEWCWRQGTLWRLTSGAVLVVFVLLQVGWTIALARRNDYRTTYLPVIAFLKEHAPPSSLINGSTELGFALGFYNKNLTEDAAFGYYTKKPADFIVIDQDRAFGQSMPTYKTYAPSLYAYETDLLSHEYKVVYDHAPYMIYARVSR